MAGLSILSPFQVTFTSLCSRWAELKKEIELSKEMFLAGHGSDFQFELLQELVEEYDQLELQLGEIYRQDKELANSIFKKFAA
jgi:hypothetical protein